MNLKIYLTPLVVCFILLTGGRLYAQTGRPGFVQQDIIKVTGITADSQTYTLGITSKQTTRMYYDGLGRSLQTVALQSSPLQNDLIQPMAYDNLGRQIKGYLPYAGKSTDSIGIYRRNAITTDQPAFYNQTTQYLTANDAAPYAQKVFENSPLQRLLQAGQTGSGYQPGVGGNHYQTAFYRPNTSADGNILIWNPDGTFTSGNYYTAGSLSVTDGKDEDGVETQGFADYSGHTILKRQILSSGNLDTYYIYNMAGMISFIVPPKATGILAANSYNLSAAPLSNLVFHFVYNNLGQLIQKTVPAKGTMYIVYDPLNRPVLMQDANMLANNQWNYIKYDVKGRAISQGIYTDSNTGRLGRANMQTYVSGLTSAYSTTWYESRTATVTSNGYYTIGNVFPTTATGTLTPLAYAYFDDYYMTQGSSPDFSYVTQGDPSLPNEETATAAQLKGMPTITCKTTVGSGLSSTWLTTVIFYDRNLHVIQQRSNNHVYYTGYNTSASLTDTKTVVNDFTGTPMASKVAKQSASGTTTTVYTAMTYDQVYRVKSISQKYNTGSFNTVAAYTYNELGQAIQKGLGQVNTSTPASLNLGGTYSGSSNNYTATNNIILSTGFNSTTGASFSGTIVNAYLQTVDFRYNIRGQLTSINNSKLNNDGGITNTDATDLFGMQMLYDQTDANLGNTPSYDGKLSAVKWMSKDASNNSSYERSYSYSYDGINRYAGETYAERATTSTGAFNNNVDGFDENGITYDQNGNIQTLARNSSTQGTNSHTQIDNLTYSYSTSNPNQLQSVADASGSTMGFVGGTGSYTYDTNGNLTADPYKKLTLAYDVLNKTDKITVTTGTGQYINYTYDANGTLIRKQAYNSSTLQTTTDYVDGFVYITQSGTTALSYFPMPEGRVLNNAGTFKQEFIITDQQGNARISFQDNGSGVAVVKQENSYYGFGMQLANSPVALPTTPNKQLYNGGSEWQNDYSNLPDYQQTFYRNYDAALGRFIGVDPEAESAESLTSYNYAGNNPIMFNDPIGNKPGPAPAPDIEAIAAGIIGSFYGNSSAYGSFSGFGVAQLINPGAGDPIGIWGDAAVQQGIYQDELDEGGLYEANPQAYQAYVNSTNGTMGGTSLYNATNGTGDLNVVIAGVNAANAANAAIDFYIDNDGGVSSTLRDGPGGVTVSTQNANNAWSFANQGGNPPGNGISVVNWQEYHLNTNGYTGVLIDVGVRNTGQYSSSKFNFFQVVTVTRNGKPKSYIDNKNAESNFPFYYTDTDEKNQLTEPGSDFFGLGLDGAFHDRPARSEAGVLNPGDSWSATLFIVQILPNGNQNVVYSYTYGFSMNAQGQEQYNYPQGH
jgi:RHS repeat-associated protein